MDVFINIHSMPMKSRKLTLVSRPLSCLANYSHEETRDKRNRGAWEYIYTLRYPI